MIQSYNNAGHLESGYGYGDDAHKGFDSHRQGDDAKQDGYGSNHTNSKGRKVQEEVDKVVDIMNENIQMVVARGEDLKVLDDRTGQLHEGASQFRRGATDVRKKMWWRNMKLKIILAIIVIILIIVIVGKLSSIVWPLDLLVLASWSGGCADAG
ncbi:Vesicle membrane receptor protein (v-SNARE) [Coemansia thaxteri]|uniref:Vesicle membrane receptor protein (V-SNARE) n=1 Tax=Coemansia thaxteri TaxID=2663907 RepID=A0A9W8BHQ9_9FUNG|nr:Vesicle membrane receptor protein (v-SNARE) [Coemansia thaxteri]